MNGSQRRILHAMFWKECRENAPWALLAALGLGLALAMNVTQSNPNYQYSAKPFDAFWAGVNTTMTLGPMLTALLLGLTQILPEQRRDQWAFLVHRPISRTALFGGKACAGLALYLLAAMTPFLAVSAWAATPGNMAAPFDPRLMLAGVAGVLGSVGVYFAALTAALRPARWYGSRILPLVAAVGATYALISAHEFWQTLALAPFALAPFVLAAWSSFVVNSEGTRRAAAGRVGLGVTLFAGGFLLCMVGCSSVWMAFSNSRPSFSQAPSDQYELLKSGRIVRATYNPKANAAGEDIVSAIHDLNGRSLPVHEGDFAPTYSSLLFYANPQYVGSWDASYTRPQRYIQQFSPQRAHETSPYSWFYSALRRRIVVYSHDSRRVVREIGVDEGGRNKPFPEHIFALPIAGDPAESLYIFSRQIYFLNPDLLTGEEASPDHWSATPFLDKPLPEDLVSSMNVFVSEGRDNVHVLCTAHRVTVADSGGRTQFSIPIHPDPSMSVTVLPSADGPRGYRYFFWTWSNTWATGYGGSVTEYSSTGQVLQVTTLPELAPRGYVTPSNFWIGVFNGAIVPAFAASIVAYHSSGSSTFAAVIAFIGFGTMWGVLAFLSLRRAGLPYRRRIAAALAGFIFGLPALLTILSLYRWPARVACPQCGRARLVDRDCCEHCGAAFPSPACDGTEIFEKPGLVLHTEAA